MWSERSYKPSDHQYQGKSLQKWYENWLMNADTTDYMTKQWRPMEQINYMKSVTGIHTNTNL